MFKNKRGINEMSDATRREGKYFDIKDVWNFIQYNFFLENIYKLNGKHRKFMFSMILTNK